MTTCTATSRTGKKCKARPIPGGTVCRHHGGAAPQVQAKAMQRILAAVDPAAARLIRLALDEEDPQVALRAIKDVLDRAGLAPKQKVEHSGEVASVLRFDPSKYPKPEKQ